MNREDIIRMAHEVGLEQDGNTFFSFNREEMDVDIDDLERFAVIVASAEREACAKISETPIGEYEVVVACGTEPTPSRIPQYANWQDIAKAIRARGQA